MIPKIELSKLKKEDVLSRLLSLGIFSYCRCALCNNLFNEEVRHPPVLVFKNSKNVCLLIRRDFYSDNPIRIEMTDGCPLHFSSKKIDIEDMIDFLKSEDRDVVIYNIDIFRSLCR